MRKKDITASTLVQAVVNATSQSNAEGLFSTPPRGFDETFRFSAFDFDET